MLGSLAGVVLAVELPMVIIEVAGVGYEVEMPLPLLCQLQQGQNLQIWTHMVVREDAQLLYGFTDKAQKQLFKTLIKINGVGPKMAMAILSTYQVADLSAIVQAQNSKALTLVPGVGAKTAERLLIELRDRLKTLTGMPTKSEPGYSSLAHAEQSIEQQALEALQSLGYKRAEAENIVSHARKKQPEIDEVGALIRLCLQSMGR